MKSWLSSGWEVAAALVLLSRMAPACGDPSSDATAGAKAKLVVQTEDGRVRIGEVVYANLILPEKSKLQIGTLTRASCTSFKFKVEPQTGWRDPWIRYSRSR